MQVAYKRANIEKTPGMRLEVCVLTRTSMFSRLPLGGRRIGVYGADTYTWSDFTLSEVKRFGRRGGELGESTLLCTWKERNPIDVDNFAVKRSNTVLFVSRSRDDI